MLTGNDKIKNSKECKQYAKLNSKIKPFTSWLFIWIDDYQFM